LEGDGHGGSVAPAPCAGGAQSRDEGV
jgi:hypothetical protein